nr:hypothetical protein [Tanacetum cinerariifolium]
LKDQLRERDETVWNLQSEINISKMLNFGGNDDSTASSVNAEIASLKAKRVGKPSSGTTKPANPKVITPGMYAVNPKYIVPHCRDNRETPILVPKKKHVTLREPQSTTRITSKPDTAINQPNVSVPLSTRVKPASGASKPGPKSNA